MGSVTITPEKDILEEARRIISSAEKESIVLRLFGGMAIRIRCPSATHRQLQRNYADIDFMGFKKQSREIRSFFKNTGYASRDIFNALQGDRRLIFNDLENQRRVDIFLDVFEMCHRFELKHRLGLEKMTIPLADLLATKLQVVEITEREYRDIIALVRDHEISETDEPETINGTYLASLASDEWGVYKTFSVNIANIQSALERYNLEPEDNEIVRKRLGDLQTRIENFPKTMRWKLRARVGEKVKWYELPEQDQKVVDSRASKSD